MRGVALISSTHGPDLPDWPTRRAVWRRTLLSRRRRSRGKEPVGLMSSPVRWLWSVERRATRVARALLRRSTSISCLWPPIALSDDSGNVPSGYAARVVMCGRSLVLVTRLQAQKFHPGESRSWAWTQSITCSMICASWSTSPNASSPSRVHRPRPPLSPPRRRRRQSLAIAVSQWLDCCR